MSGVHSNSMPAGWIRATLGELVESIQYGHTASAKPSGKGPKFLRITDIQNGNVDWHRVPVCDIDSTLTKYRLEQGDIVFARTGATTGKSYLIHDCPENAVFASYLIRLRLPHDIQPQFVWYYFQTNDYWRQIEDKSSGIAQPGVNASRLQTLQLRLAPLPEQSRIVEAIETNLTKLDAAVAALKRVQVNLKRYRVSVLKAAVEGRLVPTEAELARQEGRDYEPAPVLLKRILAERRRRWEATQLAQMKANGKTPKNDKWKAKYEEPVTPDTDGLPELPNGWCWATLALIADLKGGVTKGQKRRETDSFRSVPYLRVANVQRGYLDLSEIKEIEATEDEISELRLLAGDILFNEGGDRDKLGRGWVWEGEIPECIHQNHVFRARLISGGVEAKFVSWFGNTFGQRYFMDEGKQTTNLASINMTKLCKLPVPLAPVSEGQRIVIETDRQLSDINQLDAWITANLKRCNRLRQSILKWAFEGKLVDQDPNDEPAAVLLERIRLEREKVKSSTSKAKVKKKAA